VTNVPRAGLASLIELFINYREIKMTEDFGAYKNEWGFPKNRVSDLKVSCQTSDNMKAVARTMREKKEGAMIPYTPVYQDGDMYSQQFSYRKRADHGEA